MRTKPKKMPRGKPFQKGYDERRNLLGAPQRGDSYAEHFDKSVQMTPAQIIELIGVDNDLGRAFLNMPQDVPIKMLLSLRNIAAEMFEPSAGRMVMMMERTEGKLSDKVDLSNSDGTLKPDMPIEQIAQRVVQLEEIARQRKEKDAG